MGSGQIMMVSKRYLAVVVTMLSVGMTGLVASAPARAAGSCDALQTEFQKKVRPAILRLAKKEFHLSNWYHATLKKQQTGKHPTLADIKSVHEAMMANCAGRSDKASCQKFAADMTAASRAIFNVNKRWSDAGCPGQLDN